MSKQGLIATVKDILKDFFTENGYELWNAEYVRVGKDRYLNVFIDKESGIGTDDCEKVSKYLSAKLDEEALEDLIDSNYYLVVSSPGMDRPLLTEEHFLRYRGSPVDVSLYKGIDGKKTYSGILAERNERYLEIMVEKKDGEAQSVKLPIELVSRVKLQVII